MPKKSSKYRVTTRHIGEHEYGKISSRIVTATSLMAARKKVAFSLNMAYVTQVERYEK